MSRESDQATAAAAMHSLTLVMLQRGCPAHLLDEAFSYMADQEIPKTPGGIVEQVDAAIARAKD